MIHNYIKIALRNLKKNKWFSLLNILGLSLGFGVCLLMLTYVIYENSFDSFQKNGKQIYRVAVEWGGSSAKMKFAGAMPGLSIGARTEIPEVESACKLQAGYCEFELPDKSKIQEESFYFAEPEMLQMFTLDFISGNKSSALNSPLSIVISESTARKYFRAANPIGKTIMCDNYAMKVTGVFKDLHKNTHLFAGLIASYSSLEAMGTKIDNPWSQWGSDLTYLQLKKNTSVNSVAKKLKTLLANNVGENLASRMEFVLHNMEEIHWFDDGYGEQSAKGRKIYTYIFLSASILVLLIACFNFMNLSTARYLDKFKEVGIRKVIGAARRQLVSQFLVESFMVVLVALIFGLLIFLLLYKSVYDYLGTEVNFYGAQLISTGIMIASLIIIVGFFAGSYPAWFLSSFNPVETIRKNVKISSKFSFRQISTVLQFAFSILLIFSVLVVNEQLNFVRTTDLGITKDNVMMIFPSTNSIPAQDKYEVFKTEVEKNPNVRGVTGAFTLPGFNSRSQISIRKPGDPDTEFRQIQVFPVDFDYAKALGIKLKAGRNFSRDYSDDGKLNVIINETAAKDLGYENPVGQKIIQPIENGQRELTIIGVVKDFHLYSLQNKISACMLMINPKSFSVYAVNVSNQNQAETIAYVKDVYSKVFPGSVFDFQFISDAYNAIYESEEKTLKVISIFTLLTLIITSIGIIGFASYITYKRTKEIGIRKIVGASIRNILVLIYKQFIISVFVSFVIFLPVGIYFANLWLEQYAYQQKIGPVIFIIPLILTIAIALITISFHSIKAALANPIDSLKYE
ncbi:MAG: ABC transporter permease [bacterium]